MLFTNLQISTIPRYHYMYQSCIAITCTVIRFTHLVGVTHPQGSASIIVKYSGSEVRLRLARGFSKSSHQRYVYYCQYIILLTYWYVLLLSVTGCLPWWYHHVVNNHKLLALLALPMSYGCCITCQHLIWWFLKIGDSEIRWFFTINDYYRGW